VLARAAVAAGVDGVFMEVHDNPKEAMSDGPNALESTKLRGVLKELLAIQRGITEAAKAI
jgi:2-dehydro-3-deoxyphosphooctonate aldolase (KDO 8-P synthase)